MAQARSVVIGVDDLAHEAPFELIVLGAGAAGLAAAVFAGLRGARVLVVESSARIGGTSALTAGTLWLPGRHPTDGRSAEADAALAAAYLDAVVGDDDSAPLRARFLSEGARIVTELEARTRVSFSRRAHHPDYFGDAAGASVDGRAIEVDDFDGRLLGDDLRHLRAPLPDFTILGGLAPSREELARWTVIARRPFTPTAWRAALRAMPRVARHATDRARKRRGTHLTLGNALVGRLLASLRDLDTARILLGTSATEILQTAEGEVHAAIVRDVRTGATARVDARAGVVSATGGFSRGERRGALLRGVPDAWSAVAESITGEAHPLLERVGAVFGRQGTDAFWAPVSLVPARDGTRRVYPHFALDRGKPGFVLVDADGRRFVSEAAPYHVVGDAMRLQAQRNASFLIASRSTVLRFGLGVVRPGGWGMRRRLRDGYVVQAATIAQLAERLGMSTVVLGETIDRFSADATRGVDSQHGRGGDPYQRNLGDPTRRPNPTLGPVGPGPYFALRLHPGDIGSASGFVADDRARALDADGRPIPGLHVLGSDMRSIMGGAYPGPGITLGPAIVFAELAVRDALERTR